MTEPTEHDLLEVIDERDRAEDWADKLAAALAPADVIGEHSSGNNPWANALQWAEEHPRPRLTTNEAVLLQRRRDARQRQVDCQEHVYDTPHWGGALGYRYYCRCGDSAADRTQAAPVLPGDETPQPEEDQ